MNTFKIGTRLTLGFSFFLFLIVLLAGISLWRLDANDHSLTEITQLQDNERLIAEWEKNIALNTVRTIAAARTTDTETQRLLEKDMTETSQHGGEIQRQLRDNLRDAKAIELFETVQNHRSAYRDARSAALQKQEQGDTIAGQRFFEQDMETLIQPYMTAVAELLTYQQHLKNTTTENLAEKNQLARLMMIILGITALITGIILSIAITRSIVRPLSNAVQLAQTVASRDLSATIHISGKDETSLLLRALQQMNSSLRSVVGDVRHGANEIATASNQILAGNQDLSSRTEEQASSLTETASAMEELTATVRQNADNAQQANTLAMTATSVATRGGEVVAQVISTMDSINESSKKVEDIIGVIDSIAFQTNILALNAAVESARAGEAGRGFAVVAGEVRSLAQRSAQAAREIKELITASVTAAATGHRLVAETGATMQEIVEAIQRVTDIMGEITAASQEQSTGIEQVNSAVIQMDQTTRQNAALVEQAAAAAGSLQEQASRLDNLVATFKLSSTAQAVVVPAQYKSITQKNQTATPPRSTPVLQPKATPRPALTDASTGSGLIVGAFQTSAGPVEEWEEF